jgi:hypothetical protein
MTAGNNLHARFIRYSYPQDDEVGGALPSGTITYDYVEGRINANSPIPAFAMQGLETDKVMTGEFWPGTLDIREYDQCEVVSPPNHPYIGEKFRIDTVQKPNYHPSDPRGFLILTLVRSTKHGNEYQ